MNQADQHRASNTTHARAALEKAVGEPEAFVLQSNAWVPNNRHLPVLFYHGAFALPGADPAGAFETLFGQHGWPAQWRDSVFDYHHYHSTAHEVLGVVTGQAELILGGPGGRRLDLEAGDVLVLPAGTGHCLSSAGGGFQVVGAYPPNQQWDIRREALGPDERRAMEALPFPASDPLGGPNGALPRLWHVPTTLGLPQMG
jgi:uncharacterized protein YjlB